MSGGDLSVFAWALRSSALLGVFVAVGALMYAFASLPAPPPPRLGLAGLERQHALSASVRWRLLEPLVRWSGQWLDALLTDSLRRKVRRKLVLAGDVAGLVPGEFVALCMGAALIGVVLGRVYAIGHDLGPMATVAGLVAGGLVPLLHLDTREQERRRRAQLGLPQVIDLLALGLSAGLDFPGALRQVVSRSSAPRDALIGELRLVLHQLETGKTRSQALWLFAERLPATSVREFVAAVVLAEESGTPLAEVLQTQAKVSRQRRSEQAEEAASRANLKMLLPVTMAFACVLLVLVGPIVLDLIANFKRLF